LQKAGWKVAVIWECETKNVDKLRAHISDLLNSSG
jgi:G:T-mismatch repair DNA endonuclease (very short patch repair protein)